MNKLSLLIFFLFSIVLNAQKGLWLCKNYRVVDSTQVYSTGSVGLIIDFDNLRMMTLMKDTIVPISINKLNKTINNRELSYQLNYSLVNNTIEIKDNNVVNVFYPFKFKKGLNFSKEKVYKKLTSENIKPIRDSLKIKFTKVKNSYYPTVRILKTKFLNYDELNGNWFINKINNNLFLGISSEFSPEEIHYYRITSLRKNCIDLENLIEYDFIPNLKRLNFVKR